MYAIYIYIYIYIYKVFRSENTHYLKYFGMGWTFRLLEGLPTSLTRENLSKIPKASSQKDKEMMQLLIIDALLFNCRILPRGK